MRISNFARIGKLKDVLNNIAKEVNENNNEKNNYRERYNKIKKAFNYIERQYTRYVSDFDSSSWVVPMINDPNCKY